MKKIKIIIFLLIITNCLFIKNVIAEEVFRNNVNIIYELDQDLFNATKISDGYIIVTHEDYTKLLVRKSNLNGENAWIKEIPLTETIYDEREIYTYKLTDTSFVIFTSKIYIIMSNDGTILSQKEISAYNVVKKDNLFYLENYNEETEIVTIEKRNNQLEVLKQFDISTKYKDKKNVIAYNQALYVSEDRVYTIEYYSYTNEDSTLSSGYSLNEYDLDLNYIKSTPITGNYNISYNMNLIKVNDDFYYAHFGIYKISQDGTSELFMQGEDSEGIYHDYSSVIIIDDYIVATSFYGPYYSTNVLLEIYDMNFNLIRNIDASKNMDRSIENIFQVGKTIIPSDDGFIVPGIISSSKKDEIFATEYILKHKVIAKTDGNGSIEISNDEGFMDELITFIITPKEGYVLSEIKVTDSNGNVLTFTDNTFTMPSSDVTIEATFIPKNPDTKDIVIILVIGLLTILIFIITSLNKKKEWLNK
ncbi:MAG: hypothetical protein ACI4XM_03330 [Candidatus Coprovivens sp.]